MGIKIEGDFSGKPMLLEDLEKFVAAARSNGATGQEVVCAHITLGGKLKSVSVNFEKPQ